MTSSYRRSLKYFVLFSFIFINRAAVSLFLDWCATQRLPSDYKIRGKSYLGQKHFLMRLKMSLEGVNKKKILKIWGFRQDIQYNTPYTLKRGLRATAKITWASDLGYLTLGLDCTWVFQGSWCNKIVFYKTTTASCIVHSNPVDRSNNINPFK